MSKELLVWFDEARCIDVLHWERITISQRVFLPTMPPLDYAKLSPFVEALGKRMQRDLDAACEAALMGVCMSNVKVPTQQRQPGGKYEGQEGFETIRFADQRKKNRKANKAAKAAIHEALVRLERYIRWAVPETSTHALYWQRATPYVYVDRKLNCTYEWSFGIVRG